MKVCEYCDSVVDDNVTTCPSCQAHSFKMMCPVCGTVLDGPICPVCQNAAQQAEEARQRALYEEQAVIRANTGLGWKAVLTFFFPFIGGWLLVNRHVVLGYRVFGIAWCVLFTIFSATSLDSAGERIVMALLCIAPVAVYFIRLYLDKKKGF